MGTLIESISDTAQAQVRSAIARRADEARITGFATAALTGLMADPVISSGKRAAGIAWATSDAMEAEWQKRFGQ